eukprot:CAMPEP_0182461514 /NCGR_PEP_ID=MMETSP1319-20130603/6074_1 /TAXON_ID=172717 /ORGANISM="Bolidomonas pacifica, Strain RCC208" /LENGTH=125 /DNA_ID=CAMNT_0024660819 /DNA_START=677 /DNA_END=1051 /DNA_ORIENTATION=-
MGLPSLRTESLAAFTTSPRFVRQGKAANLVATLVPLASSGISLEVKSLMSVSERPMPYSSAVSKKPTPLSVAVRNTSSSSASSFGLYPQNNESPHAQAPTPIFGSIALPLRMVKGGESGTGGEAK